MVKNMVKKRFAWLKGRKRIGGCAAVALAAVVGLSMVFHGKGTQNRAAEVSVRSAAAEKGNISKTVTGTGTLENGESEEVLAPVGVRVEKVLVDSGDTVTKGQQLATLNEASVAEKLLEVKESLEDVEDEIDDLSDDAEDSSTSEYLKAKVLNGKKKELEETEKWLEKLLESKELTAVCDGVISGVYVETDAAVSESAGEEESISGEDGGNLTAGAAGQIDAGTIAVSQESTEQSRKGSGILFLSADVSGSGDAGGAGGSVTDSAGTEKSAGGARSSDGTGGTGSASSSGSESGTSGTGSRGSADGSSGNSGSAGSSGDGGNSGSTGSSTDGGNSGSTGSSSDGGNSGSAGSSTGSDASGAGNVKITSCSVDVTPPVTGAKPQTELGAADYFTGTISWNCSSETFQEETAYTAAIKLTAKKGYEFSKNILPEVKGADVSSEVRESDSGESILRIKARFSKTGKAGAGQQTGDAGQEQDKSKESGGNAGDGASGGASAKGAVSGSVSARGGASGSVSAGTSGSSSVSGTSSASDYSAYETPAFSIAAQDETVVSVNVDELDILSIEEGQTAEITIDALEEQSFEGKITDISQAVSGSGSTKYPVEITIGRTDDMRMGMSVSATITIDEAKDAVLVPVSALQERGGRTFVYTESSEDGTLSGETEVTTGLSDGSRAEIISGLAEGDTVYYLRAGSDDSERTEGMPGMNRMPGQGMPGGNMPDFSGEPGSGKGSENGGRTGSGKDSGSGNNRRGSNRGGTE